MSKDPCLSIIVPVYKAEEYLQECITSILTQTFQDFELILVDDGSPDLSGEICDKYAQKDNRLRVIHKKNEGVSSARNAGVDKATGKYIAFVDADDNVEPDMYAVMVAEAESKKTDYIICGFNELNGKKKKQIFFSLPDRSVLDRDGIINRLLFSIYSNEYIINSPCNKLYLRELIMRNGLKFPNRKRAEDWMFNIWYLDAAQSAVYINEPLYNYVRNDQSAMSRVLPEQYNLWKENLQVKQEIAHRYKFDVDWKMVNKQFLTDVIQWAMSMYKQDNSFSYNTVFEDKEFLNACNYSHSLDSFRIEMVRKMINASFLGIARLLCKI